MINWIWAAMIGISFLCAICTGRMEALSQGILEGAGNAVTVLLNIGGILCFWSGLLEIAKQSGFTEKIAKFFAPLLRRLFPEYREFPQVMQAISMNLTANLLGLGNAATPFGLKAMDEMQKIRPLEQQKTATRGMILFVILNTTGFQLIPTFLGSLRMNSGSTAPFSILPAVWITSIGSLLVGISVVFCLQRGRP